MFIPFYSHTLRICGISGYTARSFSYRHIGLSYIVFWIGRRNTSHILALRVRILSLQSHADLAYFVERFR